jgi:dynein heavy chain
VVSLQPKDLGAAGESRESILASIIASILPKLPDNINYEEAYERMRSGDGNPLKIVMMQEISRYNKLLDMVRHILVELDKGLKGLVLIGEPEEAMLNEILINKTPESWKYAYHSMKPLSSWVMD